ncbi:MAG TPA: helix-hairpin-helix domain-containing protein [Verrucomicrobiae bacterium]|nr:helix-hairpin-helix domain-containing protein [Verrucomicrobiae bacterium]
MRLPFFRSSRVEPTKAVAVPPSPTARPNLHLAETQLITSADAEPTSGSSGDNRLGRESRTPASNGQTIPVALHTISQQLPAGFLSPSASESQARITINIPVDWVLPQLATGRVTIALADLLTLLPDNAVRRPLPNGNSQYAVVLPLAEVVSALPADLLQHQEQTALDIDAPEFTQFPKLFDDSDKDIIPQETAKMQETVAVVQPKAPEPVPVPRSFETSFPEPAKEMAPPSRPLAAVMAKPIPSVNEPRPEVAAPSAPSSDNQITVSLRSLVAVMPDQFFICPRTDLWRRIDLDSRIALPSDLVLPQLKIARVRLPLGVAVGLMPRGILASPLPQISDETIPIALQEIVAQLPPNLFVSQSNSSELEEIDFSDSEIPTPFAEKSFTSAPVEVRAPEPVQPESEPATSATEPTTEPIEIPSDTLVEEEVSIFAEKSAVTEPIQSAPVSAPGVPEPTSESIEIPSSTFADEELSIFAEKSAVTEPTAVEPAFQSEPDIETPVAPVEAAAEVPAPVEQQPFESIAEDAPVFTEQPSAIVATPEPTEPIAASTEPVSITPVAETVAPVVSPSPIFAETSEPVTETPAPVAEAPTPVVETTAPATPEIVHEVQAAEPTAPAPSAAPAPNSFLAHLNSRTVEELARIEGVGPVVAQRIVESRNARGGFQSLEDLHGIPGVTRKVFGILAGTARRGLNRLLGVEHNEELTLQEVVRLTSQLEGVAGCILAMSDGVFVTGQLPPHLDQETISVFAPELFNKVGTYTKELRVGEVTRLSVFTDQQPLSIFRAGDIFLVILHDNRHFSKALLRRCERISQELAPLCRQRAAV